MASSLLSITDVIPNSQSIPKWLIKNYSNPVLPASRGLIEGQGSDPNFASDKEVFRELLTKFSSLLSKHERCSFSLSM